MKRILYILAFIATQATAQTDSTRLYVEIPKTFGEAMTDKESKIFTSSKFGGAYTNDGKYVTAINSLVEFEDFFVARKKQYPTWAPKIVILNPSDFPQPVIDSTGIEQ